MNSTSYSIYDLSVQDTSITVQKVTVLSSILFWPMTQNGPFLYSWYNMTIALETVTPIASPIQFASENSIDHEDLTYVFEQSDYTDPEEDISDLKGVEPLFFHQTSVESDPEVLDKIQEKCHQKISSLARSMLTADVFNDVNEFHAQTPMAVTPLISSLDYDYLTRCYAHFSQRAPNSEQESLELQIFLDGLANSGTPPSSLVIRDILKTTDDVSIIARLISSFPIAIRHPSEALGNELDSIFELTTKPILDPRQKRHIELAMATLISRSCKKNLCVESGLLEKYINYFEGKLAGTDGFEEQVVGVLGLGNLGLGRALEKPFEIAQGLHPQYENPVRIQAIWSLRPLILEQRDRVMTSLLPVFFNRSETCETRTSVFGFLMGSRPDERVLHEIAYFMWSEPCPQTVNIVRSTLTLMSKTEYPCNPVGSYARTVLKYLPPGLIDPLRTASYALDYYDKNNGFGRMSFITLQKTGSNVLPRSIYVGLNSYIGGFSNSFFGFYLRLQGVEKLIEAQKVDAGEGSVDKVIEILSKINIEERRTTPLCIELVVINSGKSVQYIAADEKTLGARIRSMVLAVHEARKKFESGTAISLQHPMGGIRYQQPLEIGSPVSIFANIATVTALNTNITRTSNAAGATQTEEDLVSQINVFATTGITNHIPAINTMLTASQLRTSRLRIPVHSSTSSRAAKTRGDSLQFTLNIPKSYNPFVLMVHATTEVSVRADITNGLGEEATETKLKQSCPSCTTRKTVTRGDSFRQERDLSLPSPKLLRGVVAKVKYFDCERDHSKASVLTKLGTFFSDVGKNTGVFRSTFARLALGLDQTLDTLFVSPYGETCGMKAIFSQDADAPTRTEKVIGSISKKPTARSQPQIEILSSLVLNHDGAEKSETKLDFHMLLKDNKQTKHQQINIKGAVINAPSGHSGILCLDLDNRVRADYDDPLGFTGQSEPSINQTIVLKIGKFPPGEPNRQSSVQDLPCLDNHAEITFTGDAQRSKEQIEEAAAAATLPYVQCQAEKSSNLWPGRFIPPSRACELAMVDQTRLRSANVTICYKIQAILLTTLMILADMARSSATDAALFSTGEVEIGLDMRKKDPRMDLHYSRNNGEESHFHDIDLSLLPPYLIPQPSPERTSPLDQIKKVAGLRSSCSISPSAVLTLDSFMYPISLSTDCSVLVSGDCSKRSQYAILARQMPNQQLAVIIQVQDTRIELQNPTTAVIDGSVKTFRNSEEFGKAGKFVMQTRRDEMYVTFMTQSIAVRYTGSFITVDVGYAFRGVNCGLCGNWDSNPYNDLMGPRACSRPLGPADIVQSWVVREGQCTDVGQSCPES
ncbi:Vitellogenin-6 [Orchesella cincta]|uniref:Vitellogenin-6 n=1 Tax=Orchesella cincta TaxID=48709 RepID=A0A1D2NEV9_ORCCI|nr:Vitellogenin-6 [Orchesella cincta]